MSKLAVFLYHEVTDKPSQFCEDFKLNVPPSLFRKQIDWINKNFNVISPLELANGAALPANSALITFDDAFKGAFENGISYLESKKIPSVMFMNMGHLENRTPMISSKAIYIEKHKASIFKGEQPNINFEHFHLSLSPSILVNLTKEFKEDYDDVITQYQGELASLELINSYAGSKYVFYGNHLFEHWNCQALSQEEFAYNVHMNQERLKIFKNFINLFSFPNGQPEICFNNNQVLELERFGYLKAFSSSGSGNFNPENFLLHRIVPTDQESTNTKLRLRVLSSDFDNKFIKMILSLIRKLSF
jgi:peptidoglycan/xylan/chitin deacetylase (PgdA/CDA1 family)